MHLRNNHLYYKISLENNDIEKENEENFIHICEIEFGKWTFFAFIHKIAYFMHKSEFTVKL